MSEIYTEPAGSCWRPAWIGTQLYITVDTFFFVMLYRPGGVVVQPKEVTGTCNRNQQCLVWFVRF